MFEEIRRFSSPSGALLAYRHQTAQDEARGILLICHGLVEHAQRYSGLAEAMAGCGFHVYAHDHRGHGHTVAPGAALGRFAMRDGHRRVIDDVKTMADLARVEHPGLPIVLFGHSMGGLIALNAVGAHPLDFAAVAIWNANFNLGISGDAARLILLAERMMKGSDVPSAIMPRATFEAWGRAVAGATTPHDWLSRDPAEVARYAEDPLCGFDPTVSLWLDVVELARKGARAASLTDVPSALPFHLVGGSGDPSTRSGRDVEWLAATLRRQGFRNVTCRIYPGMRHETLNETGREAAIADFAEWCLTQTRRRH